MKAVGKAAIKLYEYLGASKGFARTASKETALKLGELIAGKPRKEKKAFIKALNVLAQDNRSPNEAYGVILKTLQKGKTGKEYSAASEMYSAITQPVATRRAINHLNREIPQIISTSMQDFVTKSVTLSPETVSRIARESIKEGVKQSFKETGTMLYRLAATPINLIRSAFVPKGKRNMYAELVQMPKERFKDAFYGKLLDTKGLVGRAPAKVVVTKESAGLDVTSLLLDTKRIEGGFNGINNTIEYTKEFSNASRAMQANMLAHELRHFEQADQIIRTFGVERYIQAIKTRVFNDLCKMPKYSKCKPEEVMKIVENEMKEQNIVKTIRTSFASSISAPRINPNSVKGQRVQKYLDATENYQGLTTDGILTKASKEYLNNALEVEAYAIGKKTGRQVGIIEDLNLMNI